ncbi:MAG: hypothetical protein EXR61_02980, partial [Chloroflexi bacterium]|nr:hypothetical protein [Chloroflexota bacterium]
MQADGRLMRHLTAAIAAALVLASCTQATTPVPGAAPGSQKQFTIVMVGATATQAFWQTVQKGAEQAGKDLGVTV